MSWYKLTDMKNFDLEEYGVVQLEMKDAQEIHGGWWQFFVALVLTQALVNPQAHIAAFVQGVEEGFNATKSPQK
jgi:hypothetical protein